MVVYIFGEKYCIGYLFLYIINLRLADVAEDAFLLEVVNKATAAGIALMDLGMDEIQQRLAELPPDRLQQLVATLMSDPRLLTEDNLASLASVVGRGEL